MVKSLTNTYNKLSNMGKIFVFACMFLVVVVFFKSIRPVQEGFTQTEKTTTKLGADIYDDFYVSIYDQLVYNEVKNNFEVGEILQYSTSSQKSVILDIGCGTGHHVSQLSAQNVEVLGVDISPSMIKEAKNNYPNLKFLVGDALNQHLFKFNSFTHILCMYFTIYYFKDKRHFFDNCIDWLMPGGFLFVHLVERDHFDPILPPGNPLFVVSPQKYAKARITNTNVNFNDFNYKSNFTIENDIATFEEKIKFKNGNTRTHQQKLYMEDTEQILLLAQQTGFISHGIIDLVKVGYEYQYVYVFTKPG